MIGSSQTDKNLQETHASQMSRDLLLGFGNIFWKDLSKAILTDPKDSPLQFVADLAIITN